MPDRRSAPPRLLAGSLPTCAGPRSPRHYVGRSRLQADAPRPESPALALGLLLLAFAIAWLGWIANTSASDVAPLAASQSAEVAR